MKALNTWRTRAATLGLGVTVASIIGFGASTLLINLSTSAGASEDDITDRAAEAAEEKLLGTLGQARSITDQRTGENVTIPPVLVDGRPIRFSDLEPGASYRLDDTTHVEVLGSTFSYPSPTDVWVSTWIRNGDAEAAWGGPTDIKVIVVLEIGTGKLLSANVSSVKAVSD